MGPAILGREAKGLPTSGPAPRAELLPQRGAEGVPAGPQLPQQGRQGASQHGRGRQGPQPAAGPQRPRHPVLPHARVPAREAQEEGRPRGSADCVRAAQKRKRLSAKHREKA